MSQSLTQIYLHIVYSTKLRQPFLKSKALRDQTFAYLAGVCKRYEWPALIIGGVEDHVHLLVRFSKNVRLADFIRELKRDSSKWVKDQPTGMTDFHWQSGYGAFSISPGHVPALTEYIADQEEHHRRKSFQDEFRRLCAKYGVEIDERYVWD